MSLLLDGELLEVSTPDATPLTAWAFEVTDGSTVWVDLTVIARKTSTGESARFTVEGCFSRIGGADVTDQGGYKVDAKKGPNMSGTDLTLDISGAFVQVTITGVAATVKWGGMGRVQRVET